MTKDQALRLALEALEKSNPMKADESDIYYEVGSMRHNEAITAIKQALEQPEEEPVAWMYVNKDGECEQIEHIEFESIPDDPSITPLYTSPPKREPLTDDELKPICDEYRILFGYWVNDFARAIEAKLKEKNT